MDNKRKFAAGLMAASLIFTVISATACGKDVSGTFSNPETTEESTTGTGTETTSAPGNTDNGNNFKASPDKASLFNKYEALTHEQLVQLDRLCVPQIGGDDLITWGNEKDFYNSLSPESKKLAGFKDIRDDKSSNYSVTEINIADVKDPVLQKTLASYVKNGYTITSTVGENSITYNGERLVGNIFFNNGYHIDSYSENLATTGFVVKITDELFQAYMYALSRRAVLESAKNYDYTVTSNDGIHQVRITCKGMSNVEIEYDPSTGIMTYIIKIDPSDTVG